MKIETLQIPPEITPPAISVLRNSHYQFSAAEEELVGRLALCRAEKAAIAAELASKGYPIEPVGRDSVEPTTIAG